MAKRGRPKKVVEEEKIEFSKTKTPGIQVKKLGMITLGYKVTYDKGRKEIYNPKTERYEVKQCKSSKMFKDYEEAVAFKEKMDRKRKGLLTEEERRLTFEDALEDFLDYANYNKLNGLTYKNSVKSHVNHMRKFFDGPDERKYIDAITTLTIEDYFEWCHDVEGLTKSTITHHKTTLLQMWKYLSKNGTVPMNDQTIAMADIRVVKSDFEGRALTIEEFNRMIQYAAECEEDLSILSLVLLAGGGGLRRGELAGLRWENVNFNERNIRIIDNRVQVGTKETVKRPKTNEIRNIPMHDVLFNTLKVVKEWQEVILKREVTDADYVYMTKINLINNYLPSTGKISRRFKEFEKRMNKYFLKAGEVEIEPVRLHDLRHTFVTNLMSGAFNSKGEWIEPADIIQIHFASGHKIKSADTTATKRYLHDLGFRDSITKFFNEAIEVDILPIIEERKDDEGKILVGEKYKKYKTRKAIETRAKRAAKEVKERIVLDNDAPLSDIHEFKRKEIVEEEPKKTTKKKVESTEAVEEKTTTKAEPTLVIASEPEELIFK